ncbi:GYDIA family GHMP kinase [Robertkochia sediminum]|uniref:GYDIA family GHMP kinase n=1 Tax=Robertkochia sediminum TaxID=2785326 RepID=UPI001932DB76|nr:GYDIA family GHMP kinase [Robertkochia sediminum]MBL7472998.1 GHMP kinase [Robertkochia sediminum]
MQNNATRYYSHGKLLLSGEYLILDGATGLALPTKAGQHLEAIPNSDRVFRFTSTNEKGDTWFRASISPQRILEGVESGQNKYSEAIEDTTDTGVAKTLVKMLMAICEVQPGLFDKAPGLDLNSHLEFPRDWGLGSSSTFINNLAQWSQTDPYAILKKSLGGSGYDIACAASETPLTYRLNKGVPVITEAIFDKPFKDQLYFIHLNKKQNSRQGIASYRALAQRPEKAIAEASEITKAMLSSEDLAAFGELLDRHETLIGKLLDIKTVKEEHFPDFEGHLKSLGAWGGDFIMAATEKDPSSYFKDRGYHTIVPYRDMIL